MWTSRWKNQKRDRFWAILRKPPAGMFLHRLKALKTAVLQTAYRTVPLPWWSTLANAPVLMPLYHLVSDESVPHVRHLYVHRTVREFERDLDFILKSFEPVGLDVVCSSLDRPSRRQHRCFHLTFDDGFREQYDIVAPLLLRKGVPASFYLATSFLDNASMAHRNKVSLLIERLTTQISPDTQEKIRAMVGAESPVDVVSKMLRIPWSERDRVDEIARILEFDIGGYLRTHRPYLTTEQVRALRGHGFAIGAHSCDHPFYGDIPLGEQLSQTRKSLELTANITGEPVRTFAFPFSSKGVTPDFFDALFNERHIKLALDTGGLARHFHPRCLPRVIMEQGGRTASEILTSDFVRAAKSRGRFG